MLFQMPYPKKMVMASLMVFLSGASHGQTGMDDAFGAPRITVRAAGQQVQPSRISSRILYPWKTYVTCTVFWVGEPPPEAPPVPHHKSSWDQDWVNSFGGYDNPKPSSRIANHGTGEFRPKGFIPKMNPFYVALPYNDISPTGIGYKPVASRVIPWFSRVVDERDGRSVCKGRWVQVFHGGRSCYAQWEDCGPWRTNDWTFVFGSQPPKTTKNGAAGIDISPSIRDYLQLKSGEKVHWRFVETGQVPYGPWKKYGSEEEDESSEAAAKRNYLEYLRQLRNEEFQREMNQ